MPGPFRLLPGPAGDLTAYASSTTPGTPVRGHVLLCHDLPRPKSAAADVALASRRLADLLTCCERDQFQPALERAAHLLAAGGLLVLHDSFLWPDATPAPEVVLSAFHRHVVHGGSRSWTLARLARELESLGLHILHSELMPGGTQLVTAGRSAVK